MDSEACLTRVGTCFLRSKSEAVISPPGKSLCSVTLGRGNSEVFRGRAWGFRGVQMRGREEGLGAACQGEDGLGLRTIGKGLSGGIHGLPAW